MLLAFPFPGEGGRPPLLQSEGGLGWNEKVACGQGDCLPDALATLSFHQGAALVYPLQLALQLEGVAGSRRRRGGEGTRRKLAVATRGLGSVQGAGGDWAKGGGDLRRGVSSVLRISRGWGARASENFPGYGCLAAARTEADPSRPMRSPPGAGRKEEGLFLHAHLVPSQH